MHSFAHPLVAAEHPLTGMPIVALLVGSTPIHDPYDHLTGSVSTDPLAEHGITAKDAQHLQALNVLLHQAGDAALNEGCSTLQTGLGIDAGDFAGSYFSDDRKYMPLVAVLRDYMLQEFAFGESATAKPMTLCQKIVLFDAEERSPMDAAMVSALADLVQSLPAIISLATAVRQLEHQGLLAMSASGHDDIEMAKHDARNALAKLTGIA